MKQIHAFCHEGNCQLKGNSPLEQYLAKRTGVRIDN